MISPSSVENLLKLKQEIQKLSWVHGVITLLDIPLLNSTDQPLVERLQNFRTLKDDNIDKLEYDSDNVFTHRVRSSGYQSYTTRSNDNTTSLSSQVCPVNKTPSQYYWETGKTCYENCGPNQERNCFGICVRSCGASQPGFSRRRKNAECEKISDMGCP